MALIATGTAVFLSALPAPTVPKIVPGNSWTNTEKLNELQRSLQETFDRNREIYQLKSSEVFNMISITIRLDMRSVSYTSGH